MRIVKLSIEHMKNLSEVEDFFGSELYEREPRGKFYSYNNIRKDGGLYPGEWLVFSYKTKIVYIATAQTSVKKDEEGKYFCVNMGALVEGSGERLNELGKRLKELGKIQNEDLEGSQGWNIVEIDDDEAREILQDFAKRSLGDSKDSSEDRKGATWARSADKEEILQIEENAVESVTKYYEQKGYEVVSVEPEKCGWDLDATRGKEVLYIEVKGHKGPNIQFELTPNEYSKMKEHYQQYRVCVVCNALSGNPKLTETLPREKNGKWFLHEVENNKIVVRLEEKIAAAAKSL